MHKCPKGRRISSTNRIDVSLSQFAVLHKRKTDEGECLDKRNNENTEDEQILESVIAKLGCVPTYWMAFLNNNQNGIPKCNSYHPIEAINTSIDALVTSVSQGVGSCQEMLSSCTVQKYSDPKYDNEIENFYANCSAKYVHLKHDILIKKSRFVNHTGNSSDYDPRVIMLKFKFLQDTFEELTQEKAFGFELLWSNIGGFVGIFIGYSLLQVPEVMSSNYHFFVKIGRFIFNQLCRLQYIFQRPNVKVIPQ